MPNKAKGKGKRDGTPDKGQSEDGREEETARVIFDESIARLRITDEDLQKSMVTSEDERGPTTPPSLREIMVMKEIPESERKPIMKRIGLLKRAPADAPLCQIDTTGRAGPRYDMDGHIIPHSILGPPEDFYRIAYKRGDVTVEEIPREFHAAVLGKQDRPTSAGLPFTSRLKDDQGAKRIGGPLRDPEASALDNWMMRMAERRRVQKEIAKKTQRPTEDLVMNSAEDYRKVQEDRYLIDRSMPFIQYGKGFRVGSEFWKQSEVVGEEEDTALRMTLGETEQGYPPPIEHIGLPRTVRLEKGVDWEATKTPRYPWKFPYYRAKCNELHDVMEELDPYPAPEFNDLEVIGRQVNGSKDQGYVGGRQILYPSMKDGAQLRPEDDVALSNNQVESNEMNESSSDVSTPIPGPSLNIGGYPARWTGDTSGYQDYVGIDARVIFQCHTNEKCVEYLEITNDGTTVLQYGWKQLPKANPFDLVQAPVRIFYFDTQGGVLLPGQTLRFPFVFKSGRAGIFTESWHFETVPVVCGGASLMVTLRGIALEGDPNAQSRMEIETNLRRRAAEKIVRSILHELLAGIQPTERPKTPIDTYVTQEEIFKRQNPQFNFATDAFQTLGKLYSDLLPEEDQAYDSNWDLSSFTLREDIFALYESDIDKKEESAKKMYTALDTVSLTITQPKAHLHQELYTVGYETVLETADQLFDQWSDLRSVHGLPELEVVIPEQSFVDKKKGGKLDPKKGPPAAGKDAKGGSPTKGRADAKGSASSGGKPAGGKASAGKPGLPKEGSGLGDDESGTGTGSVMTNREDSLVAPNGLPPVLAEEKIRERIVEQQCHEKIYGVTYAALGVMVEKLVDLWDNCSNDHGA